MSHVRYKKKNRNRKEIIDAAIHLFITIGFRAANIQDIVRGTNLSRGTFYNYFKNKDEIWDTLFSSEIIEIQKESHNKRQNAESSREWLKNIIAHGLYVFFKEPYPALIARNQTRTRESIVYNLKRLDIYSIQVLDFFHKGFDIKISESMLRKVLYAMVGSAVELLIINQSNFRKMSVEEVAEFLTSLFHPVLLNPNYFEPKALVQNLPNIETTSDKYEIARVGPREQKKLIKKKNISDVATALFIEKGLESTTIDDIVNSAGISRGSFYNYFKSKEEIWHDLFVNRVKKVHKLILVKKLEAHDAESFLRIMFTQNFGILTQSPFPALLANNQSKAREILIVSSLDTGILARNADDLMERSQSPKLTKSTIRLLFHATLGASIEMIVQSYFNNENISTEELASFFAGVVVNYSEE